VIARFLGPDAAPIAAAAFGIAGPVVDDAVVTTNLPWHIRASALRTKLGTPHVRLLNDLEATAYGALVLPADKLHALNVGVARTGNRAVIAAGTGLGQALLFWDGARHVPVATEGGHTDFAPRDAVEHDLLRWLERKYDGHVSYERTVSGHGLVNIFTFLDEHAHMPVSAETRRRLEHEDPAKVIGELGTTGACATAVAAVERFVGIYGAQAGNVRAGVHGEGPLRAPDERDSGLDHSRSRRGVARRGARRSGTGGELRGPPPPNSLDRGPTTRYVRPHEPPSAR